MAFNFVGRLQLVGPANVSQIVTQINRQLSGIRANVNIQISPNTAARIGQINNQLATLSTQLRAVAANATAATAAINGLGTTLTGLNQSTGTINVNANKAVQSIKSIGISSQEAATGVAQFGEQAGLATRRFLAFSLAAGSLVAVGNFFRQGIANAIGFERQLVRLNQVGSTTRGEIRGIADEISRVSTAYGTSSKDLSEVAVTLRQAGLQAGEVRQTLDALAQSALAPTFTDIKKTTEGLIATFAQFKLEAKDTAEILGIINSVSAGLAVESDDIVDAIRRSGGAFAALASSTNEPIQNLREFISVFSSIRATTRESADTIATGLRSIFTRLQRPETVDALKSLGINLRFTRGEAEALGRVDLESQFVGAYEAVVRLSEGLRGIPDTSAQFSQIVERLGGIYQVSRVLPLLSEGGSALRQQALALSRSGSSSLNDSTEKGLESLAVRGKQVFEEFQKLFRLITEDTGFQVFARGLLLIAEGFAKVLQFAKPLLPVLLTLASVNLFQKLGSFGVGFANKFANAQGSSYYNVRGYAKGGKVQGQGGTDSELIAATPGEYILKPDVAQRIGYNNLDRMQNGGQVEYLGKYKNFYRKNGRIYARPSVLSAFAEADDGGTQANFAKLPSGSNQFQFGALVGAGIRPGTVLDKEYQKSVAHYNERALKISKGNPETLNALNNSYRSTLGAEFQALISKALVPRKYRETDASNLNFIDPETGEKVSGKRPDIKVGARLNSRASKFLIDSIDTKSKSFNAQLPKIRAEDPLLADILKTVDRIYIDFSNITVGDYKISEALAIGDTNRKNKGFFRESLPTIVRQNPSIANRILLQPRAKGGIVPGVGNTDSVPAALEQGDYVIRKSSARQAGYGTLQALAENRFAEGGIVPSLLMPGEFIFDKSAAAGLGKENLDLLNRTGKTDHFKRFAFGTPSTSFTDFGKKRISSSFSLTSNPAEFSTGLNLYVVKVQEGLQRFLLSVGQATNAQDAANKAAIAASIVQQNILEARRLELQAVQATTRAGRLEAVVARGNLTQEREVVARQRILEARAQSSRDSQESARLLNSTDAQFQRRGIVGLPNLEGAGFSAGSNPLAEESRERRRLFRLQIASLALPFVGQAAEALAPADAEAAVKSRRTGSYTATQAVSGGLTGAATGAAIGSAVPIPGGIIIGAIVGGLYGLISSFDKARKDIANVKIGAALQTLITSFGTAARNLRERGAIGDAARAGIVASGDTLSREIASGVTRRILIGSGDVGDAGVFTPGGLFPSRRTTLPDTELALREGGGESRTAAIEYRRRLLEASSTPEFNTVLESEILRLRRTTAGESGVSAGLRPLFGGDRGTTDEFIRTRLGGERGLRELGVSLERREASARTRSDESSVANGFVRLTQAATGLIEQFGKLSQTAQNLDAGLGGTGQQAKVNSLEATGRIYDANYLRDTRRVVSGLGIEGSATGTEILSRASTVSSLSPVLEGLISRSRFGREGARTPLTLPLTGIDTGLTVGSRVTGAEYVTGELRALFPRLSESVLRTISSGITDAGGITETTDTSAIARTILERIAPPTSDLAKLEAERRNILIDSLNRQNQLTIQAISLQSKSIDLEYQRGKVVAQFTAQNSGLGADSNINFLRFDSEARYRADLSNTLQGTSAAGATGPEGVLRSFEASLSRLRVLGDSRENSTERGAILSATQRFRTALEKMADVTSRTADATERLNRIQASRESRLAFNERYITSSPEERFNQVRGLTLAQGLYRSGGNIGQLDDESRSLIVNSLNALGRTQLGFAGGQTAEEVKRTLIGGSGYGLTELPGETAAANSLQQQILVAYNEGIIATRGLADLTKGELVDSNRRLIESLTTLDATIRSLPAPGGSSSGGVFSPIIGGARRIADLFAPLFRNSGGPVYANNGLFVPRGSDTVPAMLTPGEYVINRDSTRKNRALLEAINNDSVGGYSNGGAVYLAGGGLAFGPPPRTSRRYTIDGVTYETPTGGGPARRVPTGSYTLDGSLGTIPTSTGETSTGTARTFTLGGTRYEIPPRRTTPTPRPGTYTLDGVTRDVPVRPGRPVAASGPSTDTGPFGAAALGEGGLQAAIIARYLGTGRGRLSSGPTTDESIALDRESVRVLLNQVRLPGLNSRPDVSATSANIELLDRNLVLGSNPVADFARLSLMQTEISRVRGNINYWQGLIGSNPDILQSRLRNGLASNIFSERLTSIEELQPGLNFNLEILRGIVGRISGEAAVRNTLESSALRGVRSSGSAAGVNSVAQQFGVGAADNYINQEINSNLFERQITSRLGDRFSSSQNEVLRQQQQNIYESRNTLIPDGRGGFTTVNDFRRNTLPGRFLGFNEGGLVPGGGSPDSIPAYLSAGEYVLNSRAVKNIGVPTLNRANYYNEGGAVNGTRNINGSNNVNGPLGTSRDISNGFASFANSSRLLVEAMANFPSTIKLEASHRVEVIHNGIEIFANLEDSIKRLVIDTTEKQINKFVKEKLPDISV